MTDPLMDPRLGAAAMGNHSSSPPGGRHMPELPVKLQVAEFHMPLLRSNPVTGKLLHEQIQEVRFHSLQRWVGSPQFTPACRSPRLASAPKSQSPAQSQRCANQLLAGSTPAIRLF